MYLSAKASKYLLRRNLNKVGTVKSMLFNSARQMSCLSKLSQRSFFVLNKSRIQGNQIMSMSVRSFATYPPHVKLGLPNLSPTMEKVHHFDFKLTLG